jgi:hypothetical protein
MLVVAQPLGPFPLAEEVRGPLLLELVERVVLGLFLLRF